VSNDPYADPATGVLRNKLGLATAVSLEAAEREITQIMHGDAAPMRKMLDELVAGG
jgi:fido (protein-threonine AMPylation protein)